LNNSVLILSLSSTRGGTDVQYALVQKNSLFLELGQVAKELSEEQELAGAKKSIRNLTMEQDYATVKVTAEKVMGVGMWVVDVDISKPPFRTVMEYSLMVGGWGVFALSCYLFLRNVPGLLLTIGVFAILPVALLLLDLFEKSLRLIRERSNAS
jgi:hypothetical protein